MFCRMFCRKNCRFWNRKKYGPTFYNHVPVEFSPVIGTLYRNPGSHIMFWQRIWWLDNNELLQYKKDLVSIILLPKIIFANSIVVPDKKYWFQGRVFLRKRALQSSQIRKYWPLCVTLQIFRFWIPTFRKFNSQQNCCVCVVASRFCLNHNYAGSV